MEGQLRNQADDATAEHEAGSASGPERLPEPSCKTQAEVETASPGVPRGRRQQERSEKPPPSSSSPNAQSVASAGRGRHSGPSPEGDEGGEGAVSFTRGFEGRVSGRCSHTQLGRACVAGFIRSVFQADKLLFIILPESHINRHTTEQRELFNWCNTDSP